jgi:ribosomal protein S8
MSAKNKSQTSEIINLLRKQGYITSYEAIEKFGATRLSGIIFILRERGFGIETKMVQGKNRYGHITNYAIYRLTKDIEEVEE